MIEKYNVTHTSTCCIESQNTLRKYFLHTCKLATAIGVGEGEGGGVQREAGERHRLVVRMRAGGALVHDAMAGRPAVGRRGGLAVTSPVSS